MNGIVKRLTASNAPPGAGVGLTLLPECSIWSKKVDN
jgi:hypothetical protein